MPQHDERVFTTIQRDAFERLSPRQRETTNLFIDKKVYAAGETIGNSVQKIKVETASVLVFADDHPLANFGHDCRYLLYHPENGTLQREILARFPPSAGTFERKMVVFNEPVKFIARGPLPPVVPEWFCPRLVPKGNRYAILAAGCTQARHLNDMEFAYRTLINNYGFHADNIYVLNYDGARQVWDSLPAEWPGNDTGYTIQVTDNGSRAAFQRAFADLAKKIGPEDLLFIHTNNHGDGMPQPSFMCMPTAPYSPNSGMFPNWDPYYATDFASDLAALPKYRALMVMMEQCGSGGFNAPILAKSTAASTSVASACLPTASSYASADGNWDSFAYDWVAAMHGSYPNGSALASNPDTNGDGVVDAQEAFNYAVSVQNPYDTPNFNETSAAAGATTLTQQYALVWTWCYILRPILEPIYGAALPFPPNPPDPAYFAAVNRITPELQKLLLPAIDRAFVDVRRELTPQIEAIVRGSFGKAAAG
ncbi:MAG: hypothetical protein ABSH09_02940 [Bryobacteraceae bacterium]|jgi:hypothetical protein